MARAARAGAANTAAVRVDPTVVDRVLDELVRACRARATSSGPTFLQDRKILSRLPFVNLDDLSLQIDRTDGQPWNSPANTPFQGTLPETVNQQMRIRHTISLELCVDYGFPTARAK